MEELTNEKKVLYAFRNMLALNHVFIDDIRILDVILKTVNVMNENMDFTQINFNDELERYYNKIYFDAKEFHINYLKKENETLSKL